MADVAKIKLNDQTFEVKDAKTRKPFGQVSEDVENLKRAYRYVEQGNLSALGAGNGQVPVADGRGDWVWGDHNADVYSDEETYAVNRYVLQDGKTYRCVSPIDEPKEWDPTDWTESHIADDVSQVLTWIENADEKFSLKNDNLLNYSKGTHRIPYENDEHRTVLEQEDGGIYFKSDGSSPIQFQYFNNTAAVPGWFVPGATYKLEFDGIRDLNVALRIYVYLDGRTTAAYSQNILWAYNDSVFTVPANTTGLQFRIQADATNAPFEKVFYPKLYLLEESTEPFLERDYEPVTIPQEVIGWQDFEKVGNHIWMFTASGNSHSVADGLIDILDADWHYIKSIPHNIGHCNTASYDPDTDSLLITNHLVTDTNIYIFRHVSQWENLNTIDYDTVEKLVINLSALPYPMYNNACWGERKRDGYRYIYLASNVGNFWTKLELAAENGYYTGAYTALWQRGSVRNIIDGVNTAQVIQGMSMYRGKIYGSISHNPIRGAVYTFTRSKIMREIIHVDGTGLVEGNEGCTVIDGILYLGCSSWAGAASAPVVVKIPLT